MRKSRIYEKKKTNFSGEAFNFHVGLHRYKILSFCTFPYVFFFCFDQSIEIIFILLLLHADWLDQ